MPIDSGVNSLTGTFFEIFSERVSYPLKIQTGIFSSQVHLIELIGGCCFKRRCRCNIGPQRHTVLWFDEFRHDAG